VNQQTNKIKKKKSEANVCTSALRPIQGISSTPAAAAPARPLSGA